MFRDHFLWREFSKANEIKKPKFSDEQIEVIKDALLNDIITDTDLERYVINPEYTVFTMKNIIRMLNEHPSHTKKIFDICIEKDMEYTSGQISTISGLFFEKEGYRILPYVAASPEFTSKEILERYNLALDICILTGKHFHEDIRNISTTQLKIEKKFIQSKNYTKFNHDNLEDDFFLSTSLSGLTKGKVSILFAAMDIIINETDLDFFAVEDEESVKDVQ